MPLRVGDPINLDTKHGSFHVRHVQYRGKEGVCLRAHRETPEGEPVLVRVQSSCLFGESFWATDCDCAWQLQRALSLIAESGGLLIYFYEEGRGAGLEAKIEAIRLQQTTAMTTTQAYACLKLEPDVRNYEAAGALLQFLLPGRGIALLTNDPRKEMCIRETGVDIVMRLPLINREANAQTRRYLEEKTKVLGHVIAFDDKNTDTRDEATPPSE